MASAINMIEKIINANGIPAFISLSPFELEQLRRLAHGGRDLTKKLGDTMTWNDRGIAFKEWSALVDTLDGSFTLPELPPAMPPVPPPAMPYLTPYSTPPLAPVYRPADAGDPIF